jgi:hypothetical protein
MRFLARAISRLLDFFRDDEPCMPYPLCPDEWQSLLEAEQERRETQALQGMGLKSTADGWTIPAKAQPSADVRPAKPR